MNLTYKSKKLEKTLNDDVKLLKTYGDIARELKQRHDDLIDAPTLQDIKDNPTLRLHQLIGKRKLDWAITIHRNWRLCFQVVGDIPHDDDGHVLYIMITDVKVISVEDYH